jgi:hypothetical protein
MTTCYNAACLQNIQVQLAHPNTMQVEPYSIFSLIICCVLFFNKIAATSTRTPFSAARYILVAIHEVDSPNPGACTGPD